VLTLASVDGVAACGGRTVLISSLAAFAGARSRYGQANLELECGVLDRGGIVLRPGVVFGADAGGLFAPWRPRSQAPGRPADRRRWQWLFVTHDRHLRELIAAVIAGSFEAERPYPCRDHVSSA